MSEVLMTAEIDLYENAIYAVVDGQVTKMKSMYCGTDEIIWKDGKVYDVIRSHRVRLKNAKEISENP